MTALLAGSSVRNGVSGESVGVVANAQYALEKSVFLLYLS